jgi:YD repeat-containing protein
MNPRLCATAAGLLAILLAGCGGADAPETASGPLMAPQATPRTGPTPPARASSQQALPAARRGGPLALNDGGFSVDTASREEVRLFYSTVYTSTSGVPTGWLGNVAGCVAGDTSAEHKSAVLRRLNWYRAMAGVPASVTFDATLNAKAQQAALWMAANNTLDHTPPSGTPCYNATVAEAAGISNLAYGSTGVGSVTSYIEDAGDNNPAVGHRRWLLYPQTQVMGTGDIGAAPFTNVIWVQDSNLFGPRPATRDGFVAWPPKGYTPYTEVYPRWSLSYPNANFSAAIVTMTENGNPIAATMEPLTDGFGENTLVWRPGGYVDGMIWAKPAGDTSYTVTVSNVTGSGVPSSFSYTTIVFDPEQAGAGDGPIVLSGSAAITAGQPSAYSFAAVPGATAYQWRALTSTPFTLNDGAESGTGNFTVSTSAGYSVVASGISASGANSFHLAHAEPVDQTLTLNQQLVAGAGAMLQFSSRLGLSSPDQHALVEVSTDDGASWTIVYDQAGQQTGVTSDFGELSFSSKNISLAAYANRVLRVRFRYAMPTGLYYFQSDPGIGWYIDNVHGTGLSVVTPGAANETAATNFQFTPSAAGSVMLQARPGMYGYFAAWGLAKTVTVAAPNPIDCAFTWIEDQYPALRPRAASGTFDVFYYRYYPVNGGIYLLHRSTDDYVYYYDIGGLHDIGTRAAVVSATGCS